MTPGVFSVLNRNRRKHQKLDVTGKLPQGGTVRFWGPEALTGIDLAVLQGLVAMAGKYGIDANLRHPNAGLDTARKQLVSSLESVANMVEHAQKFYVQASYARLASEIGLSPLENHQYARIIRQSLERLYAVTITFDSGSMRVSTRMISTLVLSGQRASMVAILNGFISQAIVGEANGFAAIPMGEVRRLRADAARIIHQHLCAVVFPGREPRKFALDTLVGYVFVTSGAVPERTVRKRRALVREALAEITALGWNITLHDGVYKISREAMTPGRGHMKTRQPRSGESAKNTPASLFA